MTNTDTITPFGPEYDKNESKRRNATLENTCVCCGRRAGGPKGWWALVVDGGAKFGDPSKENEDEPGFMGYYPIGSTCKKSLPEGWAVKTSDLGW